MSIKIQSPNTKGANERINMYLMMADNIAMTGGYIIPSLEQYKDILEQILVNIYTLINKEYNGELKRLFVEYQELYDQVMSKGEEKPPTPNEARQLKGILQKVNALIIAGLDEIDYFYITTGERDKDKSPYYGYYDYKKEKEKRTNK